MRVVRGLELPRDCLLARLEPRAICPTLDSPYSCKRLVRVAVKLIIPLPMHHQVLALLFWLLVTPFIVWRWIICNIIYNAMKSCI